MACKAKTVSCENLLHPVRLSDADVITVITTEACKSGATTMVPRAEERCSSRSRSRSRISIQQSTRWPEREIDRDRQIGEECQVRAESEMRPWHNARSFIAVTWQLSHLSALSLHLILLLSLSSAAYFLGWLTDWLDWLTDWLQVCTSDFIFELKIKGIHT